MEREFRGFGMVEQLRHRESSTTYHGSRPARRAALSRRCRQATSRRRLLTKTWFHQGPVGDEFGDWEEAGLQSAEYWPGDPPALPGRTADRSRLLRTPCRAARKRDALRTLRGSILRTELYALDGTDAQDRPYTVTEALLRPARGIDPASGDGERPRIFFPLPLAQRTTQWERGDDPMTQFSLHRAITTHIRSAAVADAASPCRAAGDYRIADATGDSPISPPARETDYAATRRRAALHRSTAWPTPAATKSQRRHIRRHRPAEMRSNRRSHRAESSARPLNFYDGAAFRRPALRPDSATTARSVRTESLVLTETLLHEAVSQRRRRARSAGAAALSGARRPAWTDEYPAEFRKLRRAGRLRLSNGRRRRHSARAISSTPRVAATTSSDRRQRQGPRTARGNARPAGPRHASSPTTRYELLPVEVTDAVRPDDRGQLRLSRAAAERVTDPNGNSRCFTFTPLGLLRSDRLGARQGNVAEGDRERPGVGLDYDFLAFSERAPAGFVRTIRRISITTPNRCAAAATRRDHRDRRIFRRLRAPAANPHPGGGRPLRRPDLRRRRPLPADQSTMPPPADVVGVGNADAGDQPNVVVSGWQVYDNKGRVVEKYEPFFARAGTTPHRATTQLGQKATMFYDPRGQVIRTLNPDGSEQRVIYGVPADPGPSPNDFAPTPWEAYTYDANDNAGPHPMASASRSGYQAPLEHAGQHRASMPWAARSKPSRATAPMPTPTGTSPAPPTTSAATC